MIAYERDYGVARFVFAFLELLGWAALVVGAFVAVFAFQGASQAIQYYGASGWAIAAASLLPGFGLMVGGLFSVANAQSGRAHVDTAEMTRELLQLARKSPGVSHSPVPVMPSPPVSKTPNVTPKLPSDVNPVVVDADTPWHLDPALPRSEEDGEVHVETYRSVAILIRQDGYYAGGTRFATRREAKQAIDTAYERRAEQRR